MSHTQTETGDLLVNGYGILNREPLVIHIFRYLDDIFPTLVAIAELLGPTKPAVLLVSLGWSVVSQIERSNFKDMVDGYHSFRQKFPGYRLIYLGNDATEVALLQQFGLEGIVCQHNSFLTPDDYNCKDPAVVQKGEELYDAVCVARLHPYKRIELMREVPRSALIAGSYDLGYYEAIKEQIAGVTLINGVPGSQEYEVLSRTAVLQVLRSACVGLCLSEVEGAMFASAEYLLTGLPVVSTYSIGGRDAYWNERYCFLCPGEATEVAAAVVAAKNLKIDPRAVRSYAVSILMEHRLGLLRYLWQYVFPELLQPTALYSALLDPRSRYDWQSISVRRFIEDICSF